MRIPSPGYYSWAYPSSMVSPYYCWLKLLGYETLDINEYPDGSWEVIEFLNAPIIPHLTKWQMVLGPMKNVEISFGFLENYIKKIDLHRREFWAREEEKTRQVLDEHKRTEIHKQDSVARAHRAITRNPDLMERIAKNGIGEMDVGSIFKHIPRHKF